MISNFAAALYPVTLMKTNTCYRLFISEYININIITGLLCAWDNFDDEKDQKVGYDSCQHVIFFGVITSKLC